MVLLCIKASLSHLTEISSIELTIESNFSLSSDSVDSFRDGTFK